MMKYGISELSFVPVRKDPNDRSEMTTQILFGEIFQILDEQNSWSYIKLAYDNYDGWIDNKAISIITKEFYDQINSNLAFVTQNISNLITFNKEQILLPAGASLPKYNSKSKTFIINENKYQLAENYSESPLDIAELSKQFLNSPYLWGGKNPFGIDCSGFVQVVYKILGKKLYRDANQQVESGDTINFIAEVVVGDLAFFDNEEGDITHVGIVLNQSEIIHASGKVRIDKFDQQGIFNSELKKYTHKLRVIKRIL